MLEKKTTMETAGKVHTPIFKKITIKTCHTTGDEILMRKFLNCDMKVCCWETLLIIPINFEETVMSESNKLVYYREEIFSV